MIDLETYSTRPNARIVQVAAVAFEARSGGRILNGKAFNSYVSDANEALIAYPGHVDPKTVAWWAQQEQGTQNRLADGIKSGNPESIVLSMLELWPEEVLDTSWNNIEGVWAHGATFDLPVLHSAFVRHERETPWNYHAARDTRTLYWLAGGQPQVDETGLTAHDAMDDCIRQIMQVQQALNIMGR